MESIQYVIDLSGQGDRYLCLVSFDVLNWILSPETPGRKGEETCWFDTDTPEELRDLARTQRAEDADFLMGVVSDKYRLGYAEVTIGSTVNDRALFVTSQIDGFNSSKELLDWCHKNGIQVKPGFEGYIY